MGLISLQPIENFRATKTNEFWRSPSTTKVTLPVPRIFPLSQVWSALLTFKLTRQSVKATGGEQFISLYGKNFGKSGTTGDWPRKRSLHETKKWSCVRSYSVVGLLNRFTVFGSVPSLNDCTHRQTDRSLCPQYNHRLWSLDNPFPDRSTAARRSAVYRSTKLF